MSHTDADIDAGELAAQIELLEEENVRLRREYARTKRTTHRHTAIGLAIIGVLALGGGLLLPGAREVLFALAATGFFGAVLTVYLTPEQFVAARVGERVYGALAANHAQIIAELGLDADPVYLPTGEWFVGQTLPADDATGPIVVMDETRGLLLTSTGARLLDDLEQALSGQLATSPGPLATQLADGLVEDLELAAGIEVDVQDTRATAAIDDPAFGELTQFDHPVPAILACGLADGLDRPVRYEVDRGDQRADWLVTMRWKNAEAA